MGHDNEHEEARNNFEESVKVAYSEFDPREYIAEYYSELGSENCFLINFYHDIFSRLPAGLTLLEFGGGPTVYQLMSASRKTTEIVFTDYLPCNLREVARWMADAPNAHSWERFAKVVAELEAGQSNAAEVQERTRSAISRIAACNALDNPAIEGAGRSEFDVVSSGFCLECISGDERAFNAALSNVIKWVAPSGLLIMTLLKNSSGYRVGEKNFPSFPVDADYMRDTLARLNFNIFDLRETDAESDQGYDGLIALAAQRVS